jgi:hypothetical protein
MCIYIRKYVYTRLLMDNYFEQEVVPFLDFLIFLFDLLLYNVFNLFPNLQMIILNSQIHILTECKSLRLNIHIEK